MVDMQKKKNQTKPNPIYSVYMYKKDLPLKAFCGYYAIKQSEAISSIFIVYSINRISIK